MRITNFKDLKEGMKLRAIWTPTNRRNDESVIVVEVGFINFTLFFPNRIAKEEIRRNTIAKNANSLDYVTLEICSINYLKQRHGLQRHRKKG